MPCMAHVLNLGVQRGLKELGNEESHWDSEDDENHIEGLEATVKNHLVRFFIDFENLTLQLIFPLRGFDETGP